MLLLTEDSVAVASREPAGVEVFEAATGRRRFAVVLEPRTLYREPFLVDEDRLFLAVANQRIEIHEMSTGRRAVAVELPPGRSFRSGLPVPGGVLVTTQSEDLLLLDAETGRVRWTAPPPPKTSLQYQCEAADDRLAYAVRKREADQVYAVEARDLATGEVQWNADLLAAKSATPFPILTDRHVVYHVNSYDFGPNAWTAETVFIEKQTGAVAQRLSAAQLAGLYTYPWIGDGFFGLFAGGRVALFGR
jgi:outer membrane protein assembly factor BamB